MPELRVFASMPALAHAAASAVATSITSAVRAHGRCSIALAGGNTPRTLYELLATDFRRQIPWEQLHVFWGDERVVPPGDIQRNDRMAREMLLDRVPCPDTQIHPMAARVELPADEAARAYEATMRQYFAEGRPRFDVVLLGLGADGHTASLFPHSPALDERQRWVRAVTAPATPPSRLTLTLPVFAQAADVHFLVAGADKSRALHAVLSPSVDPTLYPAAAVRPIDGQVTWWTDAPAAGSGKDQDMQKGAVEGTDKDPIAPIQPNGANFDDSEVSNADEKGHTNDHPRDEQR